MDNKEYKKFNFKSLFAKSAKDIFEKQQDGTFKLKDQYKGKVYGKVEQGNQTVIVGNDKEGKKKYRGSFNSLGYKVRQYVYDRLNNNGDKSNKVMYLIKGDEGEYKHNQGTISLENVFLDEQGRMRDSKTGEIIGSKQSKTKTNVKEEKGIRW